MEERVRKLEKEIEDWKKLFYLLKSDYELQENFQTNEWMIKAKTMNIEV